MIDLTPRQKEILEFYLAYTFDNLAQPDVRHIGVVFEIMSTNGVMDHLRALRRKGYFLDSRRRTARSDIGITAKALQFAIESMPEYRDIAESLLKKWITNPDYRIN
jgi:SOS-response transcriptional repressor LexA